MSSRQLREKNNSSPFSKNDTTTTQLYTLSLHDALPISAGAHELDTGGGARGGDLAAAGANRAPQRSPAARDRKSTRLNSSHMSISYAVFCLKKKISRN